MAVRVTFTRSYLAGDVVLNTRFVHFSSKDQSSANPQKRGMGLAKSPCQSSVNISQWKSHWNSSLRFFHCTITSLPHVGRVATTSFHKLNRCSSLPPIPPLFQGGDFYRTATVQNDETIGHHFSYIPLILNIQYSKYILTWLSTTLDYHVLFMLHFNTCHATAWKTASPEPISPSLASHLGYACQLRGFRRPLLFRKWPETQWKLRTNLRGFPCDFHVISHLVNSIWADDILDLLAQLWPGETTNRPGNSLG